MELTKETNQKISKILEAANDVIFDVYHIQDYSDTLGDVRERIASIRNSGKKIETLALKILNDIKDINIDIENTETKEQ